LAPEALTVWQRLAPHVPAGNLNAGNADLFGMLCTSLQTYAEADSIIAAAGLLITAGQDLIPSPALQIRTQADGLAARWARTFGLTPDAQPAKPAKGAPMRHLREA
ncbi:MAG: P27 family phage terminase small subunit, partial [Streptosporangiaceae bacterium]